MLVVALDAAPVFAQAWPNKAVRMISAFPPGGGSDVVGRIIGPKIVETLGQPFIIENRTGAAGNVGFEYASRAAPDGYTILIANNSLVSNPAIGMVGYDPVRDFTPIIYVGATAVAIAAHPSFPGRTVAELIDVTRREPGKFAYSSCGNGSVMHLAAEMFKLVARVDITHVPYRGCAPAVVEGIAGTVPLLFNTITNVNAHVKAGKLNVIALGSPTRSELNKAYPVVAESPGFEGFNADIWFGFLAPAGTPRDIVSRLHDAIAKSLTLPDVQERFAAQLFAVQHLDGERFGQVIRRDVAQWAKIVREANIKAD